MFVHVHDKERGSYFKSEVYAKVNVGYYERYLVLAPHGDGAYLKLFDFLDTNETPAPFYPTLVHVVLPDAPPPLESRTYWA